MPRGGARRPRGAKARQLLHQRVPLLQLQLAPASRLGMPLQPPPKLPPQHPLQRPPLLQPKLPALSAQSLVRGLLRAQVRQGDSSLQRGRWVRPLALDHWLLRGLLVASRRALLAGRRGLLHSQLLAVQHRPGGPSLGAHGRLEGRCLARLLLLLRGRGPSRLRLRPASGACQGLRLRAALAPSGGPTAPRRPRLCRLLQLRPPLCRAPRLCLLLGAMRGAAVAAPAPATGLKGAPAPLPAPKRCSPLPWQSSRRSQLRPQQRPQQRPPQRLRLLHKLQLLLQNQRRLQFRLHLQRTCQWSLLHLPLLHQPSLLRHPHHLRQCPRLQLRVRLHQSPLRRLLQLLPLLQALLLQAAMSLQTVLSLRAVLFLLRLLRQRPPCQQPHLHPRLLLTATHPLPLAQFPMCVAAWTTCPQVPPWTLRRAAAARPPRCPARCLLTCPRPSPSCRALPRRRGRPARVASPWMLRAPPRRSSRLLLPRSQLPPLPLPRRCLYPLRLHLRPPRRLLRLPRRPHRRPPRPRSRVSCCKCARCPCRRRCGQAARCPLRLTA